MSKTPYLRYNIVKKIERPGLSKPYWAPVGQITLFQAEDKTVSGKCTINIFGESEFHVFAAESGSRDSAPPEKHDPF